MCKTQPTRLCHLHLFDPWGNKETIICNLTDGAISYRYYGGWGSSGTPYHLSNLGDVHLPLEKISDDETKEDFVQRVIDTITHDSVCRVAHNCRPVTF